MDILPTSTASARIGFHYFPDTFHYRENDLHTWVPTIKEMGATWLVLAAPADRAIPEYFIRGLVENGIEPVLRYDLSLAKPPACSDLAIFLENYARWGAKYVVFFDRPNARSSWPLSSWAQEDLVDRFLDRYIPLADCALQTGLVPVLPPLEPGGSYWDTSFLREALLSLRRRKQDALLERMTISAYCWTGEHGINWGAGGPERWPGARPYFTPAREEDQKGFRIFDWYLAVSQAALGRTLPVLLFGAGAPFDPQRQEASQEDPQEHAQRCLDIARLMSGMQVSDPSNPELVYEPVPTEVLSCSYWLLSTGADDPRRGWAWFSLDGQAIPAVDSLHQWASGQAPTGSGSAKCADLSGQHPIRHYLLLPTYEWGIADWHLDIIRPFVKKYQPAIGFSVEEARLAAKVTVVNGPEKFPETVINQLRSAGCLVEEICGDGTSIATQIAER